MNFDFTPEQMTLRDDVRQWAHAQHRPDNAANWLEMGQQGWLSLGLPPHLGGLRHTSAIDTLIVLEALGQALVELPYGDTALVGAHLIQHGMAPAAPMWLMEIAAGHARLSLAHLEPGMRHRVETVRTQAQHQDGNWTLQGHKSLIIGDHEQGALLVSAQVQGAPPGPEGMGLFLISLGHPGLQRHPYVTIDGRPAFDVHFDHVPAILHQAPGPAWAWIAAGLDRQAVAHTAEAIGVMHALLELTRNHLQARRQFGQPLALFQVLRHRMAELYLAFETARSYSYLGFLKLQAPEAERRHFVALMRLYVAERLREVTEGCLHLQGAVGMAQNSLSDRLIRRLTQLSLMDGDRLQHLHSLTQSPEPRPEILS